MKVEIKSCLDGAKKAKGISVIIDVFRASNTIIACIGQGAKFIIPIGDLEEAYGLKKANPDYLLFGERKGLPPEGFDYGNSPVAASKLSLKNKKIILTTSSGSQGIVNARKADEIIIGSFANAKAVVDYIKSKNPPIVSLVAMGFESGKKAEEDELCAKYLKEQLLGINSDFGEIKQEILKCDGADRLRRLNQEDDLEFSLKLNTYDIVPKYNFEYHTITDQKHPQRFELWSNDEFSVATPANPHIPKEEGIHLRIFAKKEVVNGWEDPELCGKAFTLAAKIADIIVEKLKIVQWANLQYNGNWGLLPGYTPVFHIHVYGRKKTGKTRAQPVQLPKAPGTYNNEPLTEKERAVLSNAFKKYLK